MSRGLGDVYKRQVHDNEAIVPNGNTVLYAGDRIIIFVKSEFVKRVMPFFESRG